MKSWKNIDAFVTPIEPKPTEEKAILKLPEGDF